MKTHRQYIKERIEKKPAFAQDLAEAEREVTLSLIHISEPTRPY